MAQAEWKHTSKAHLALGYKAESDKTQLHISRVRILSNIWMHQLEERFEIFFQSHGEIFAWEHHVAVLSD